MPPQLSSNPASTLALNRVLTLRSNQSRVAMTSVACKFMILQNSGRDASAGELATIFCMPATTGACACDAHTHHPQHAPVMPTAKITASASYSQACPVTISRHTTPCTAPLSDTCGGRCQHRCTPMLNHRSGVHVVHTPGRMTPPRQQPHALMSVTALEPTMAPPPLRMCCMRGSKMRSATEPLHQHTSKSAWCANA